MLIPWRVFSNNTSGFCKKKAGFQPNVDHPPAWASWSTSTRPKRGVFWRVAHLGKASNKPPWLTICFQSRNNPGNSRSSRKKTHLGSEFHFLPGSSDGWKNAKLWYHHGLHTFSADDQSKPCPTVDPQDGHTAAGDRLWMITRAITLQEGVENMGPFNACFFFWIG